MTTISLSGIGQIHLIEHAMLVVTGQHTPVVRAEQLPLLSQPQQVCLRADLISTYLTALLPEMTRHRKRRIMHHPTQEESDIIDILADGEDPGRL